MKGDFSRLTFDPRKHFTSVLMQEGRVQLDADWNEQSAIFLHSLRTLAADLIGPFGAPANPDGTAGDGFRLRPRHNADGALVKGDFILLPGRYYVGGILCENPDEWIYSVNSGQFPAINPGGQTPYMLYLDVWERHIIDLQDETLREVALGGADTATRARVVCRVRAVKDSEAQPLPRDCRGLRRQWPRWVGQWQPTQRGRLKARARPGTPDDTDPCLSSPDARYRGENQLYRVEIHTGGIAVGGATFKWSSDNGSVVYPILKLDHGGGTTTLTLEHLGRDDRSGLTVGDWVEIADGEEDLRNGIDPLLKVDSIDPDTLRVILQGEPVSNLGTPLLLRRWDHRRSKTKPNAAGVVPVKEGATDNDWLDLEDGVQIFFSPAEGGGTQTYRSGDYWLIPARVATGDVEWPGPADAPLALPPHGVEHRYAPLGLVTLEGGSVQLKDCRTTFGCRAVRLDTGVADWQVVAEPGSSPNTPRAADLVILPYPNPDWKDLPEARWISVSPKAMGATAVPSLPYAYELSFNLCACFENAGLSVTLLADDSATVILNKNKLDGQPGPNGSKVPLTRFETTVPKFFNVGTNVLRVEVVNTTEGPTGFALSGLVDTDGGSCC